MIDSEITNITYILLDAVKVIIFLMFFILTNIFFYSTWKMRNSHITDDIIQQHFAEHCVAGFFSFIGSLLGVLYSMAHLFGTTHYELDEVAYAIAVILLIISGVLFMVHMIKEQTPGHPYYLREAGVIEKKLNDRITKLEQQLKYPNK